MSNDMLSPDGEDPGTVGLAGLQISKALFADIMDAGPDDMPMVHLSAIAELGWANARHLARSLGEGDPAWLAALSEPNEEAQPDPEPEPVRPLGTEKAWSWAEPDLSLLPNENAPAVPFPVEIFGEFWADWCQKSASGVGASVNFTAGTLLAVVGGMLANVRWAQGTRTWKHPSVLWVALIGPSATAKSPSMAPVVDLVQDILSLRQAEHDASRDRRDLELTIARSMSKHWASLIHNVVGQAYRTNTPLPEDLPTRPALGKPPAELVAHSLFFDDVTPEAIQAHASGLPRGFMVKTDELSTWFGSFARYNNKSSQGARGFWNKAFDGASLSVARKADDLRGGVRAQTEIPRLSIGLLGGTHPSEIKDLLSRDGKLSDDGMAHRILWIWGDGPTADETLHDGPAKFPDDARALAALRAIDGLPQDAGHAPFYVRATADAEADLVAFKTRMAHAGSATTAWRRSSLNKAPGLALRISNVLAHLRWSADPVGLPPDTIERDVMRDAIRFVENYCLANAERLQQHVATADAEGDARGLLGLIQEHGWTRFHLTDIKRHAPRRLGEARYRNDALEILVEAGLIRPDFHREGDTKGRMREEYLVNPQALRPIAA